MSEEGEDIAGKDIEGVVGLLLRLRHHGVVDTRILSAVERIPHSQFVPVEYFEKAWAPRAMPLPCGQTMLKPDVTGRMIAALQISPSDSILEIGTGSGYQTALLASLGRKVHSIDRYKTLLDGAKMRIDRLAMNNVTFAQADGQNFTDDISLYDRIISDVAWPETPRELLKNLVAGGIVVTAIGKPREEQMLVRLTKIGSRFERENLFPVRFGPFEKGVAQVL